MSSVIIFLDQKATEYICYWISIWYLGPHSSWTLCLLRLIMMKVDIKVKGNASVEKTITSLIMNRWTLFP